MHWITHWGLSFLILTQPDKDLFLRQLEATTKADVAIESQMD
jgi:hypothetical protein